MTSYKVLNYFTKKPEYYFTLIDQIIISLCNFLVTIIILRLLGIEIFGQFSFLWLFLLLTNTVQLSYIISPMLSNAPKQSVDYLKFFYGGIFFHQIIFSLSTFLIIYFGLKFFDEYLPSYQIEKYSLSFASATITLQIQQFFRRLLFSKKLYFKALLTDLISYPSVIILIIYLNYLNKLNLESIFWSFVFTFLLGIFFSSPILLSLKYNLNNTYNTLKDNWIIAKWMLASTLLQWFSGNLWIINTGIILGPFTLGVVRACQTVINITNIFFQSLENIIPVATSKIFLEKGMDRMRIYLQKFALKGLLLIFLLILFLIFFSKLLLSFFYGSEIGNYHFILIFLALILPVTFFQYAPIYGLRTLGKTKPIFISYLLSSFVTITTSQFVISSFNLNGLVVGLFVTQLIIAGVIYLGYLHYFKKLKIINENKKF